VSGLMQEFEEYLKMNLPDIKSFHPCFNDALKKMVIAGGKRFRPLLLLSVIEAYEPLLLKNAYPVALGVELLHTYSLIHDDLPAMDNADLRRGEQTLHKTYDEVLAILVGDALNSHAFYTISAAPLSDETKIKLVKELSYYGGVGGMVLGQAIDCYFENQKLDIEELKFLHIHKTAKLIATSLKMGAIIAGLDTKKQSMLFDFGEQLGLLFQIEDDIIDVTKNQNEAGKTTNNDKDKNSFVNLLGVDEAIKQRNELIEKLKKDSADFDEKLANKLITIIDKYFKKEK